MAQSTRQCQLPANQPRSKSRHAGTHGRKYAALARLPEHAGAELADAPEIFVREGPFAIRINDEITVDVMPAACGHGWDELSSYIIDIEVDGEALNVLSLEGREPLPSGRYHAETSTLASRSTALG